MFHKILLYLLTLIHLPVFANGLSKHKLDNRVLGVRRNYYRYIPENYDQNKTIPLIIVIHGAFSNAKQIMKVTSFNDLANQEMFAVAYPNGAYGIFGKLQHWNAGHCCGKAQKNNIDDVGFIFHVIKDIQSKINIGKVFIVGFSNGGMLAYYFASKYSEILSGIAVIAGTIGGKKTPKNKHWQIPPPKHAIPVIHFHGLNDDSIPYDGGNGTRHKKSKRIFDSVTDTINFWVKNNNCSLEYKEELILNNRISKQTWFNPQNKPMVMLYSIKNWGHAWPKNYENKTDSLSNFYASKEIWNFFLNK